MEKGIAVLDADEKQCQALCFLLEKHEFWAIPAHSLENLESALQENECIAVIMDIDTVPVDNRTIRELTIKNPGVYFFGLSKDRLHPELKDAICYHIYACLNKPVDQDELFYWLRSIDEEE